MWVYQVTLISVSARFCNGQHLEVLGDLAAGLLIIAVGLRDPYQHVITFTGGGY